MKSHDTFRCGWKYCKHEPSDNSVGSAVRKGNRYYHADCARQSDGMVAIRDFYYEHVSKTVVMKQLTAAIRSVVIDKEVDVDFALFALKYAVKNNMPIRSPYSLHYLVDNARVQDGWRRYQIRQKRLEANSNLTAPPPDAKPVEYQSYEETSHGFGSIFTNYQ